MYIQILSANLTVPKLLCNYFLWKMLIIELWFSPFLGKRQISFVFRLCHIYNFYIYISLKCIITPSPIGCQSVQMSFDYAFTLQLRVRSQKSSTLISHRWTQRSGKSGKSRFYATCPPFACQYIIYCKVMEGRWPSFSLQSSPDGL